MAIPIAPEHEDLIKIFRVYENCIFCDEKTNMWHDKTNSPVCSECAKKHKVAEIKEAKKISYSKH
jgi:hypothetical protein